MARSRNIKPGFFTNDVLGELPALARLLFAGLWTVCDRDGRVEDRPKKIKAEVLPYDDCNADELLQGLHDAGFIQRYEAAGKRFIQVCKWAEHQNPHVKEAESTIPAPDKPGANPVLASVAPQPQPEQAGLIPDSLSPDSKGGARKRTPTFDPKEIELPAWLNAEDWYRWCKDRAQRKKPVTEEGAKSQLKQLDKYRAQGFSAAQVIDHSIGGSYQGLFPPPKEKGAQVTGTVASNAADLTKEYLASREQTPEQRAASEEARKRVMAELKPAFKVIG